MTPGNFGYFLPLLHRFGVECILIGGGASIAQGLARTTYDVDIVYSRERNNLQRLTESLSGINLYYRGAPPGLPFRFDVAMLEAGLNFTLTSDHGDIDLLGEVAGGGTYQSLEPFTDSIKLYESRILVVTLDKLIELKRAAGRPKDFETIAELELLREERDSG